MTKQEALAMADESDRLEEQDGYDELPRRVIKYPVYKKNQTVGRPPDFRPKIVETYLSLIRQLNITREAAAYKAGTSPDTVCRWIKKGEKAIEEGDFDNPFATFCGLLAEAEADWEMRHVMNVSRAALGDPTNDIPPDPNLSLRLLGLRKRKDYGNNPEIAIQNNITAQVNYIDIEVVRPEVATTELLPNSPEPLADVVAIQYPEIDGGSELSNETRKQVNEDASGDDPPSICVG